MKFSILCITYMYLLYCREKEIADTADGIWYTTVCTIEIVLLW